MLFGFGFKSFFSTVEKKNEIKKFYIKYYPLLLGSTYFCFGLKNERKGGNRLVVVPVPKKPFVLILHDVVKKGGGRRIIW